MVDKKIRHFVLAGSLCAILSFWGYGARAETDEWGFSTLPTLQNPFPNTVVVGAPPNCPSQQAQYARALVAALQERGIPARLVDNIGFHYNGEAEFNQMQIDTNVASSAPTPPVYINQKFKGAPSFEQVLGELRLQFYPEDNQ